MGKIQLLDNLTIQKIAAGEVIERPASIIKELIENSLDANAKNIIVEINEGGKSYLRITDDGDGIDEEDLSIAFERHSTSKLRVIDDLNSILTLGFRGEALASVAAVAKIEVLTKTSDSSAGIHAFIEEGKIKSIDKVGTPKGTTMIVKDLFYNLPVRKKFLKSDLSEGNAISDMVYKLALGNYGTSFKLIKDNKIVIKTTTSVDIKENIYNILGKDITKGLIPLEFESRGIKVKGYISNNSLYRSNRSHEYLYINGRYIVNYGIANAIEHHYKSLIPLNRFPIYVLYIDMNPAEMDVNIHPTKQEVKFTNNNDIIGIISNIVKNKLFPSLNIPRFEVEKENIKKEIPTLFEMPKSIVTKESGFLVKDYSDINLMDDDDTPSEDIIQSREVPEYNLSLIEDDFFEIKDELKIENVLPEINPIGIVFDTYILGENRALNKLFFIDQHAAHERVMYERYRKEYSNESIHIQQLLAPEIIDLTNSEFNNITDNIVFFRSLGFELEEFGPSSYAIRGVPFLFGKPNVRNLFLDLLDNIDKNLKSNYDTRLDKLMKLACSSAIKGGDRITKIETQALLKDLGKCENPYSCPHGRPIIIEITKKDIEKQFLRII